MHISAGEMNSRQREYEADSPLLEARAVEEGKSERLLPLQESGGEFNLSGLCLDLRNAYIWARDGFGIIYCLLLLLLIITRTWSSFGGSGDIRDATYRADFPSALQFPRGREGRSNT